MEEAKQTHLEKLDFLCLKKKSRKSIEIFEEFLEQNIKLV